MGEIMLSGPTEIIAALQERMAKQFFRKLTEGC
jgi:hypothetical protein